MLNQQAVIEKVKAFSLELIHNGIMLDSVLLYGSYASNKQNVDSDIDIALVSNMFSGFGFEDRKLFSKINIKNEYIDIETKTFSRVNFDKSDPFIEEIKKTGIKIL